MDLSSFYARQRGAALIVLSPGWISCNTYNHLAPKYRLHGPKNPDNSKDDEPRNTVHAEIPKTHLEVVRCHIIVVIGS
jgi:hypothetical protein